LETRAALEILVRLDLRVPKETLAKLEIRAILAPGILVEPAVQETRAELGPQAAVAAEARRGTLETRGPLGSLVGRSSRHSLLPLERLPRAIPAFISLRSSALVPAAAAARQTALAMVLAVVVGVLESSYFTFRSS
jgi:hypothetical protein